MVKRNMNCSEDEPQGKTFELPSESRHSLRVVDIQPNENDKNLVLVKLEVCDGAEIGRSTLHRVNLDEGFKGFFFTRLFLKAIGEPYKGSFDVDTDNWIGRSFVANIKHTVVKKTDANGVETSKTFANIDKFEFDVPATVGEPSTKQPEEIAWQE